MSRRADVLRPSSARRRRARAPRPRMAPAAAASSSGSGALLADESDRTAERPAAERRRVVRPATLAAPSHDEDRTRGRSPQGARRHRAARRRRRPLDDAGAAVAPSLPRAPGRVVVHAGSRGPGARPSRTRRTASVERSRLVKAGAGTHARDAGGVPLADVLVKRRGRVVHPCS